ncbi:hypothetical protein AGOR_G00208730 [Albula goreensis]|uniref:Uncharacterized protein n=1 Tax=Albula goreensis TaxID=1534307 RepID=A0A8T3CPJ4_9TELE|nr:hypothetical protein AGOR_G00208730 [Albula goreensis]
MLKWVRGGAGLQDFSDSLLGATSFLTQRVQKPDREESSRAPRPNFRAEKNQTGLTEEKAVSALFTAVYSSEDGENTQTASR